MNRLLVIFALVGGSMIVLLALLVALASASASLANGVANAAASSALLTSQCTTVFMVVVSIAAGLVLGNGIAAFRASRRLDQGQIIPGQLMLRHPQARQLPQGQKQQPVVYPSEAEEAEEKLFQNWGW